MTDYDKFQAIDSLLTPEVIEDILSRRLTKEDMLNIYWEGNLDSLTKVMYSPGIMAVTSELNLVKRNYMHFYGIKNFSTDSTYFVSVGAGHLGGEEGIIQLLRNDGYIVEKVEASFSGTSEKLKSEKYEFPWKRFDHMDGISLMFPNTPAEVEFEGNAAMDMFISMDTENGMGLFVGALKMEVGDISMETTEKSIKENLASDSKLTLEKSKITKLNGEDAIEIVASFGKFAMRAYYVFRSNRIMYYVGGFAEDRKVILGPVGDKFFKSASYHDPAPRKTIDWKEFTPKNSNFRLLAPTLITERVISAPGFEDEPAEEIYLSMYMDAAKSKAYIFRHSDVLPGEYYEDQEETLDLLMDYLQSPDGDATQVLFDSTSTFMGYPARFSKVKTVDATMQIIVFFRGSRNFILLISKADGAFSWTDPFFEEISPMPYETEVIVQKEVSDMNAAVSSFSTGTNYSVKEDGSWSFPLAADSMSYWWVRDDKSSIQQGFLRFHFDSLYFRSAVDSALWDITSSNHVFFGDSITSRKCLDENGERVLYYESCYTKFPLLKIKGKVLLNGREAICSVVKYPADYENIEKVDSLAYGFQVIQKSYDDISISKTKEIIDYLKYVDANEKYDYSDIYILDKYKFSESDLPQIREAFLENYKTDTALYLGFSESWARVLLELKDPEFTKTVEKKVKSCPFESTRNTILSLYLKGDSTRAGVQQFLNILNELTFTKESTILSGAFSTNYSRVKDEWITISELGRKEFLSSGFLYLCSAIQEDSTLQGMLSTVETEFPFYIQQCVKSYRSSIRAGDSYPYSLYALELGAQICGNFKPTPELFVALDSARVVLEAEEPNASVLISELRLGKNPEKERVQKCLKSPWHGFRLITSCYKYGFEKKSGIDKLKDEEILCAHILEYMSDDYEVDRSSLYKKIVTDKGAFYVISYGYAEESEEYYQAYGPFQEGEMKKVLEDLNKYTVDSVYDEDYTNSPSESRDDTIKAIKNGTYTRFWDTYYPGK
jgi:hypothetical protein